MKQIKQQPLVELGLTNLEALIYTFLLENSPATGYGIAKGIGKPDANTYKALVSLQSKGVIIIEDSQTRLCRAIPLEELLNNYQKHYNEVINRAKNQLEKLKPSPADNRTYQLLSAEQVISKYRNMFSQSERVIMLEFFPYAIKELYQDIIAAAKRGVRITAKVCEQCNLPGVKVIVDPRGDYIRKRWPGQWANGVFDGEEYLLAFLSKDGSQVIQAVWSRNQYLSWIYYQGFVYELMLSDLEKGINDNQEINTLKEIIKKYKKLLNLKETGYKDASTFFIKVNKDRKNNKEE